MCLAAQDSEAGTETEDDSEAEADLPQGPPVNWRARADEFPQGHIAAGAPDELAQQVAQ